MEGNKSINFVQATKNGDNTTTKNEATQQEKGKRMTQSNIQPKTNQFLKNSRGNLSHQNSNNAGGLNLIS